MVDCGATALLISKRFVKKHKIRTHLLNYEIPLYNIDGSKNRAGKISQSVHLQLLIGDSKSWSDFLITDLGPEDVVLGLPWLRSVNPNINWAEGTMEVERETNGARVEQVATNRMQRR
jgi:Retroviral aspartyl protease